MIHTRLGNQDFCDPGILQNFPQLHPERRGLMSVFTDHNVPIIAGGKKGTDGHNGMAEMLH